jgi:Mg-chelatase subunit ChlD
MSDQSNQSDQIVRKQSTGLSPLQAAIARKHGIDPHTVGKDIVILLDRSGSMAERTSEPKTRIEALRECVSTLEKDGARFRKFWFDDECQEVQSEIPAPRGGTDLTKAIETIQKLNPRHVIVVSDGFPNDRDSALQSAKKLFCKIDTFYIGPLSSYEAIDFMRKLATDHGGRSGAVSPLALTEHIRAALNAAPGAPSAPDEPKGAIAL